MESDFGYCAEKVNTANITINDIGNCFLRGYSKGLSTASYLGIYTDEGQSVIIAIGPYQLDSEGKPTDEWLPFKTKCSFDRVNYSEPLVKKFINSFLNDKMNPVYQAEEITEEEFWDSYIDIVKYVKEGGR